MRFIARFDTRTLRTGIHAEGCSAAKPTITPTTRRAAVVWPVEAASADEAARQWYEHADGEDRKLPYPHICKCVRRAK